MPDELYDRQTRIPGWEQRKLDQARVVVLGSGTLAQQLLVNLAGLGVTNVLLQSNGRIALTKEDYFLFGFPSMESIGKPRIDFIERELLQLNENFKGRLKTFFSPFDEGDIAAFRPDAIVSAENDPAIVEHGLVYCIRHKLPFIAGSAGQHESRFQSHHPSSRVGLDSLVRSIWCEEKQNPQTSGVLAGGMADELRKYFMPLDESDLPSPEKLHKYSLLRTTRTEGGDTLEPIPYRDMHPFKALVVGAGAMGNSVAAQLALAGFEQIDIIDRDTIEFSNLSRQFCFRGKVGQPKAKVLSERVKEYSPSTLTNPHQRFLGANDVVFDRGEYDILFGAVDSLRVRKLINAYAVLHKLPYIDGGSSSLNGKMRVYFPGINRCLDCQLDFDAELAKEQNTTRQARGCAQAAPSVIIPNFVIGSAMVGEALRFFYRKSDKEVLGSEIGANTHSLVYNSSERQRLYVNQERYEKTCGGCT